jgi:hypothetical protein
VTRNTDQFSMQNGQWYRMRFSLQSDVHGVLMSGVKGITQFSNINVITEKPIPFSPERREVEMYFQCNLTDQAVLQFTNSYLQPRYWLDNAQLQRVTVTTLDHTLDHVLLLNDQATAQNFSLPEGCWADVSGTMLSGPQTVAAYSSKVIYRVPNGGCSVAAPNSVGAKVFLGGALNWSTGVMRYDLRTQGLLPNAEPYSAMGYTLENAGATMSTTVQNLSGNHTVVDWVLLELRNNDAGHTVAARRAALVKANGEVVATDGAALVPFSTTTQGRRLVIRHRNHLAVMTNDPLASNGQVVDFNNGSTALYGVEPQKVQGSYRALWCGDVSGNGNILYTGTDNDRDLVLVAIGSVVPSNMVNGYRREDINLDGVTKYTGDSNDRDLILQTIGGVIPTAVRSAQVPQ